MKAIALFFILFITISFNCQATETDIVKIGNSELIFVYSHLDGELVDVGAAAEGAEAIVPLVEVDRRRISHHTVAHEAAPETVEELRRRVLRARLPEQEAVLVEVDDWSDPGLVVGDAQDRVEVGTRSALHGGEDRTVGPVDRGPEMWTTGEDFRPIDVQVVPEGPSSPRASRVDGDPARDRIEVGDRPVL